MGTDSTGIVIPTDEVMVADRYRKEIGDVSELAQSIVDIGLLNPITVRPWHGGYRLVAGERRLTAFKSLGLSEIPARIANDIADARDALVAERDENTQRKPMLLSEATALGIAIQEMEAPAALERKAQGGRGGLGTGVPGNTSSPDTGHKTRDIAAEAIGMSPATFTRMKTLVTTASNEAEPEEVREAAREAVEEIDRGAPVRTGYDRVKKIRQATATAVLEPVEPRRTNDPTAYLSDLAALHPTLRIAFELDGHSKYKNIESLGQAAQRVGVAWKFSEKQWRSHVEQSRDILDRASLTIEAALSALDRVDLSTITTEHATEALARIDRNALNHFIRSLKEISGE